MELKRFFADSIENGIVTLTGDELYHAVKVTRHKVGFYIIVLTGDGYDYTAKITEIGKDFLKAEVTDGKKNLREADGKVILFQGLCKEFDFITQKAVELGATDIYPVRTERSNVGISAFNAERLNKIIKEAAKQCERAVLPRLHAPLKTIDALKLMSGLSNAVICYEDERVLTLKEAVNPKIRDIAVFIGAEGGFSESEIAAAKEYGIPSVTLGKRILRAETAAIAALTLALSATDGL